MRRAALALFCDNPPRFRNIPLRIVLGFPYSVIGPERGGWYFACRCRQGLPRWVHNAFHGIQVGIKEPHGIVLVRVSVCFVRIFAGRLLLLVGD